MIGVKSYIFHFPEWLMRLTCLHIQVLRRFAIFAYVSAEWLWFSYWFVWIFYAFSILDLCGFVAHTFILSWLSFFNAVFSMLFSMLSLNFKNKLLISIFVLSHFTGFSLHSGIFFFHSVFLKGCLTIFLWSMIFAVSYFHIHLFLFYFYCALKISSQSFLHNRGIFFICSFKNNEHTYITFIQILLSLLFILW